MCGICGLIDFTGSSGPRLARDLGPIVAALGHRGPDGTRVVSDDMTALGACRLAIRGCDSGFQPLVGRGGAVVVCNGEIDNHRQLRRLLGSRGRQVPGTSDVEILPGLYEELGEEFVSRLDGAFALAVWDRRRRQLLLARDRAGERPLFWTRSNGKLGFASEIGALLRIPWLSREIDRPALLEFLRRGYFVAPTTPFSEICKVGPGEVIVVTESAVSRARVWRWGIGEARKRSPSLDELDAVLKRAVRRQTDNDVQYGVFLSGGLDSSLIGSLLAGWGASPPTRAFNLRFSERSFDEGVAARRVADRLGIPLTEVWVRADRFPATLDRLLATSGEPLGDPAWVPTALLAEEAAKTVRVALVGEGADEIFGGYPTYSGIAVAEALARLPPVLRRSIRRAANLWAPSDGKVPISFLLRKLAEGLDLHGLARHRFWTAAVPDPVLIRLGLTELGTVEPEVPEIGGLLDAIQRFDFEMSLAEGLLTKGDRACMLWALELRAPFLDREVLEYAALLRPADRVDGLKTKVLLKRYAKSILPSAIVHARKRGLSVPISRWLRDELRDYARESLSSPRLEGLGIDLRALAGLFADHLERREDHGRALWTLVVVSRWLAVAGEHRTSGESSSVRGGAPVV